MDEPEWKTVQEIEKVAVPGDVIEIAIGSNVSHFIFNIRNGWCVHVTTAENNGKCTEVIKDTTDMHEEAGLYLCRINNFEELAAEKELTPRSLKNSLQIARAGLAHGPIKLALSDITPVCDNQNIAKEFCIFWKYDTTPSEFNTLNAPVLLGIVLFIVIAAGAAALLAFL